MTTHRVMKSVLHNFLGTYTSRNSDYHGYWLFGQLPSDLREWFLNLLGPPPKRNAPADAAHRLAIRRFAEQLNKSGLTLDEVSKAELQWARSSEVVKWWRGDYMAEGRMVRLSARAEMNNGNVYEDECEFFVAPHDSGKERRRNKADWSN